MVVGGREACWRFSGKKQRNVIKIRPTNLTIKTRLSWEDSLWIFCLLETELRNTFSETFEAKNFKIIPKSAGSQRHQNKHYLNASLKKIRFKGARRVVFLGNRFFISSRYKFYLKNTSSKDAELSNATVEVWRKKIPSHTEFFWTPHVLNRIGLIWDGNQGFGAVTIFWHAPRTMPWRCTLLVFVVTSVQALRKVFRQSGLET